MLAVVGYAAEIPCEVTPLTPNDAPHLVLWYKDIFGTPIYRLVRASDPEIGAQKLPALMPVFSVYFSRSVRVDVTGVKFLAIVMPTA